MARYRVISTGPEDGSLVGETLTFTEDFSSNAKDWCERGHIVRLDYTLETDDDLPCEFPLEHIFRKE
jgi:hypothetical protein